MTIALITLSSEGARLLAPLVGRLPEARLYLHASIPWPPARPGTDQEGPKRPGKRENDPARSVPEAAPESGWDERREKNPERSGTVPVGTGDQAREDLPALAAGKIIDIDSVKEKEAQDRKSVV